MIPRPQPLLDQPVPLVLPPINLWEMSATGFIWRPLDGDTKRSITFKVLVVPGYVLLLLQVLTNLRKQKAPQKLNFADNFPIEVGVSHIYH